LLVTAVDREALVREAFDAGADDYVVKGPSFMDRIADEVLANLEAPA
jgi:PleD family two-component response regulator